MEFWIVLVSFCVLCVIISEIIPECYRYFISRILLLVLIFISAFRYQIGQDYDRYVGFFVRSVQPEYIDYSYQLLIDMIKYSGFDYQMLFVCYAIFTLFFIWKGIQYYLLDESKRIYALALFVTSGCYWYSFNTIRQWAAIALCFYLSKYIVQGKFLKLLVGSILAIFIHKSALMFLLYYICRFIKVGIIVQIIIIMVSFILWQYNLVFWALEKIPIISFYIPYLSDNIVAMNVKSGIGIIIWVVFYGFSYVMFRADSIKKKCVFNMYFCYMPMHLSLLFSNPLHRLSYYVYVFVIVGLSYAFENIKPNIIIKLCVLIFMGSMWLNSIYNFSLEPVNLGGLGITETISDTNIKYEFNFKLLK